MRSLRTPSPWPDLVDLAGSQHGHVTASQALTLGLSEATLRRNLDRGWRQPHLGVYALPGAARSQDGQIMAALLATGEEVYASRWTAAWVHGLIRFPPTNVQLTVPYGRGAPRLAGVEACRSRTWRWEDTTVVRELRVATAARMVCELAAWTQLPPLRSLVIDARQRQLADLAEIADVLERMGPVRGAGRLRRILWQLDEERCDSELERLTRAAIRARPYLPRPHPAPYPLHVRGRLIHIDIAWPRQRVGAECLGMGSHSERPQLEVDALRSGLVAETGWRIFPVTWARIEQDAEGFCRQVARALSVRSPTYT
jgi:hypothetical protein